MKRRTNALTAARFALVGIAALSLLLTGCSSTPKKDKSAAGSEGDTGSEFSDGGAAGTDQAAGSGASLELGTAYFDFNRSEIRNDMRDVLRKNGDTLRGSSGVTVIEGHADERGSEEYNLALGERRAESVRKYLTALGVSKGQLKVVSYGEAKPAVRGHDESAWRWNRRAEFRAER